jgi:hypothetical protein
MNIERVAITKGDGGGLNRVPLETLLVTDCVYVWKPTKGPK